MNARYRKSQSRMRVYLWHDFSMFGFRFKIHLHSWLLLSSFCCMLMPISIDLVLETWNFDNICLTILWALKLLSRGLNLVRYVSLSWRVRNLKWETSKIQFLQDLLRDRLLQNRKVFAIRYMLWCLARLTDEPPKFYLVIEEWQFDNMPGYPHQFCLLFWNSLDRNAAEQKMKEGQPSPRQCD